jgi:hypothetical protein
MHNAVTFSTVTALCTYRLYLAPKHPVTSSGNYPVSSGSPVLSAALALSASVAANLPLIAFTEHMCRLSMFSWLLLLG